MTKITLNCREKIVEMWLDWILISKRENEANFRLSKRLHSKLKCGQIVQSKEPKRGPITLKSNLLSLKWSKE